MFKESKFSTTSEHISLCRISLFGSDQTFAVSPEATQYQPSTYGISAQKFEEFSQFWTLQWEISVSSAAAVKGVAVVRRQKTDLYKYVTGLIAPVSS